MDKDELKNRISMALKDPILQQGFEIICKENAELEQENAELKSRDCWKSCEYSNPKAELIGQHIKDVQKLTKAKDLLLRVIELKNKPCAVGHSVNMLLYENICVEAEQFIKEVEK